MVMPLAGRAVAAVAGALLVLTAWASVTGTLIVSRSVGSWLTRWVDRLVNGAYRLAARNMEEYRRRDRLLSVRPAMGIELPEEPDPAAGISLTYEEFLDAIARMREVDFPVERDAADAWPDFVGWRVNYEGGGLRGGHGGRRHPGRPASRLVRWRI